MVKRGPEGWNSTALHLGFLSCPGAAVSPQLLCLPDGWGIMEEVAQGVQQKTVGNKEFLVPEVTSLSKM